MKSHREKVKYFFETVKSIADTNNRKRKVLLTLLYWKVFDDIEIPSDVMKDIVDKGTNPETIYRSLRHVQFTDREEKKKHEHHKRKHTKG